MTRGRKDELHKLLLIALQLSLVVAGWGINRAVNSIDEDVSRLETSVEEIRASVAASDKETGRRLSTLEERTKGK